VIGKNRQQPTTNNQQQQQPRKQTTDTVNITKSPSLEQIINATQHGRTYQDN
jgi:hypothetical protein